MSRAEVNLTRAFIIVFRVHALRARAFSLSARAHTLPTRVQASLIKGITLLHGHFAA